MLPITRRSALAGLAASAAALSLPAARAQAPATRAIPKTGEQIPLVGLGSWVTFNVGDDPEALESCTAVMRAFFEAGGRLIDSSPMYGSAQATIGHGLKQLGQGGHVFSADKVWTDGNGTAQIAATQALWGISRFDLLQVHNLRDWETHLPELFAMKAAGTLRYAGITTSEGRRHDDIVRLMREQPIDFLQVTYNPVDREVEAEILPLAQERGIAVIVNRPFQQGALTEALAGEALPGFAAELGATTWAQLILKFIVSHPAVNVAIPATSNPDHARENLAAAAGPLPDAAMRVRIADAIAAV